MRASVLIQAIAFTFFNSSGASVAIQKKGIEGRPCECGESLTLSCKFDKNTFAVAWMKPSDISPIAQCIRKVCKLNPAYTGEYSISFDMKQSVFNLTLLEVTMKNNGSRLVCSDGANIDSHIIKVREYEPLLVADSENGTIKAISGCVSHDTNVSFKWIMIQDCMHTEEEISVRINENRTETCSNALECNNDNQNQYVEVVSAKRSEEGQCLKIVAVYGEDRHVSYQTNIKFTLIQDQDEEPINNTVQYSKVCAFIVPVSVLVIIVIACYFRKRPSEKKCNDMSAIGDEESKLQSKERDEPKIIETENLISAKELEETCTNKVPDELRHEQVHELSTDLKAELQDNDEEDLASKELIRNILTKVFTNLKNVFYQDSAEQRIDKTVSSADKISTMTPDNHEDRLENGSLSSNVSPSADPQNTIDFSGEGPIINHSSLQDMPENDNNDNLCSEVPTLLGSQNENITSVENDESHLSEGLMMFKCTEGTEMLQNNTTDDMYDEEKDSHGEYRKNSLLMDKENNPVASSSQGSSGHSPMASSSQGSSWHNSPYQATFDDTSAVIDIGKPDKGVIASMLEYYSPG